VSTFAIKSTP